MAAAAAEARSHGLRVDDPVVLHDLFPCTCTCGPRRSWRGALCLTGLDDVFGDTDDWAEALRWFVDGIRRRTPQ